MFASVGEIVVHYSQAGRPGAPPLVFIHSMGFELKPEAAHLPCVEQPERMAAGIRRFLQEQWHG